MLVARSGSSSSSSSSSSNSSLNNGVLLLLAYSSSSSNSRVGLKYLLLLVHSSRGKTPSDSLLDDAAVLGKLRQALAEEIERAGQLRVQHPVNGALPVVAGARGWW